VLWDADESARRKPARGLPKRATRRAISCRERRARAAGGQVDDARPQTPPPARWNLAPKGVPRFFRWGKENHGLHELHGLMPPLRN
jgi:hypothetical protein